MASVLSQVKARSCKHEGKLASLRAQVDSLWGELASSWEESSWYCQEVEANAKEEDDLVVRLNQAKAENEGLKKTKSDYATHLVTSKEK